VVNFTLLDVEEAECVGLLLPEGRLAERAVELEPWLQVSQSARWTFVSHKCCVVLSTTTAGREWSDDLSGAEATPPQRAPPRWTRVHTSAISYFLTLPMLGSGVGGFAGVFDFGRWMSESLVWPLEVVLSSGSFLRAASPVKAALNEPHSFDSVDPIFV
jgi:hypothetical protein